ncbi:MAG: DnaD domain protein [Clostridia bacterium]|nr:DnaD domain protein [Clostridia bacterium]
MDMKEKTEKTVLKVNDGIRGDIPRLAGKIALREASADDLRVLLVFLERGAERIARDAGVSEARADAALDYWREAGILTEGTGIPEPEKPVSIAANELIPMTGEETAEIIRRRDLSGAIDEAQKLLGKTFNTTELKTFAELVEQLQVEPAYILTLISWCKRRGKGTLYYVRGTAVSLVSEGIETLSQLEEHISRREKAESDIGQLRKMFGIGERALTKTEEKRFTQWLIEDKLPIEVIGIAFDMTVNNTGKISFAYIDKLVRIWIQAGCAGSAEEVEQFIERERAARGLPQYDKKTRGPKHDNIPSTYNVDDFFARALERSYGKKQ